MWYSCPSLEAQLSKRESGPQGKQSSENKWNNARKAIRGLQQKNNLANTSPNPEAPPGSVVHVVVDGVVPTLPRVPLDPSPWGASQPEEGWLPLQQGGG